MEKKAWHYVAGVVDAEGCICVTGDHYTKLRFGIGNTDLRLMKWLVRNFGSTISKTKRQSVRLGDHFYYGWGLWGKKREWFFQGILPHVMLKRRQLEFALEYLNLEGSPNIEKRLLIKSKIAKFNASYAMVPKIKSSQDAAKYVAGFLDGDGTIFISPKTGIADVGISSRSKFLIDWLIQNFGGKRIDSNAPMGQKFYIWKIYDYSTREKFLLRILPYLVLKREQAKLALKAIRLGGSSETLFLRQELGKKCVILNHGKSSVTTETRESYKLKTQSELHG